MANGCYRNAYESVRYLQSVSVPAGEGAEKIRISNERSLLSQADALAKRDTTRRSELIADGLRLVLARRAK